jgi:hypothetical protein
MASSWALQVTDLHSGMACLNIRVDKMCQLLGKIRKELEKLQSGKRYPWPRRVMHAKCKYIWLFWGESVETSRM